MRKRLLCGVAGVVAGVAVAPVVSGAVDLSEGVVVGACIAGGLVVGYIGSLFVDVFTSNTGEIDIRSSD